MAMACSYCARCTAMSVSATRVSSWVCAWATSDFGAPPTAFEARGGEPQRFGIRFDGVVKHTLLRIRGPKFEVVVSQLGMEAEAGDFQVGCGGLRPLRARRLRCGGRGPRDPPRRTGRTAAQSRRKVRVRW